MMPSDTPADARVRRPILLPLSVSEWATLDMPTPLRPSEWSQLMAVLEAMRPAIVTPEEYGDVPY